MNDCSLSSNELRENLQRMDPYQLEELVADLWVAMGYEVDVTSGTGDRGIDVVARKEDPFQRKQLLQVKRYGEENLIGSPEIRLYRTLYEQEENVDLVGIVTTSGFTDEALTLAQDLDIGTMDGNTLSEHLIQKLETNTISGYSLIERTETSEINPEQSDSSNTNQVSYDCFYCDNSFSTQSEAREHMRESHTGAEVGQVDSFDLPSTDTGDVSCPVCSTFFDDEAAMREHASQAHPNITLCSYCEQHFKKESEIREHLSKSHEYNDLSPIDQKRVELHTG